jgi:predicted metal-dependent peptidase
MRFTGREDLNSTYTRQDLAEGRIRQAISRLLTRYKFHTHVLERCRLVPSTSLDTMGVTARGAEVLLFFNVDFTLQLPVDQLGGTLLHEVLHIVLGHLTLNPDDYPDRWAFTVALEVSVNEFVHEPLPPGVIRLEQYPMLPPMESSVERYYRLENVRRRPDVGLPSEFASGVADGSTAVLDEHAIWEEAREDGDGVRKALAEVLQQAAIAAGGLPEELQQAILNGIGSQAGNWVHIIQGKPVGQLDWKRLLRHYVGQVLERRPMYDRPPRRFPALVGILPGQRRAAENLSVAAIIDTSGSISDACLEAIDGELRRLSRAHVVHVIECDCKVQRVSRYCGRLKDVTGRGGTDLRPALEPNVLRRLHPGLVIFFTDGFGTAPPAAPPWPLIWCIAPGGKPPAPYGRVIYMGPESEDSVPKN